MKKKIVVIISLFLIIGSLLLVLLFMKTDNNQYKDDEILFKNEYESLNGVEYKPGKVLMNISIPNENSITYLNNNTLINKLNNGTNIIYLGYPESNKCRSVINVLITLIKGNNFTNIYYYNIKKLLDNNKNNIMNDKEDIIYTKIMSFINSGENNSDKIDIPLVIFIKDGKYIGSISGNLKANDKTIELDDFEEKQLNLKYQELVDKLNDNVCYDDTNC